MFMLAPLLELAGTGGPSPLDELLLLDELEELEELEELLLLLELLEDGLWLWDVDMLGVPGMLWELLIEGMLLCD